MDRLRLVIEIYGSEGWEFESPRVRQCFTLVKTLFFVFNQHPRPVPVGYGSHPASAAPGTSERQPPFLPLHEMPVHILSYGDARVSEHLGDNVEISALGQHQRRS